MMRQHKRPFEKGWGSSTMNHFEGITVDDHVTGTEMLASYAAIRAKFADVRPPEPEPAKPADLIQSESPRVTLNHGDSQRTMKAAHADQRGSPLDPRLTFESFVVGRSNTLAHGASTPVA